MARFSEETRKRMSEAAKKRAIRPGEKERRSKIAKSLWKSGRFDNVHTGPKPKTYIFSSDQIEYILQEYVEKERAISRIAEELYIPEGRIRQKLVELGVEIRSASFYTTGERHPMKNPEYAKIHSQRLKGRKLSPEVCKNISIGHRGPLNSNWKGGIAYLPYCYKFPSIKNNIVIKYNNTCFLCGKNKEKDGRAMAIHHIDYDKMQGCKNRKWNVILLCNHCHGKTNGNRYYWFNLFCSHWLSNTEITFIPIIGYPYGGMNIERQ